MKRAIKNTSNLYSFLEAQGVLTSGDKVAIIEAKQKYWAQYKKAWKKAKRQESKSFTILLNFQEAKQVANHAKKFHTSSTNYIKQAAISSKDIIDKISFGEIRQLLFQHYNMVNTMIVERNLPQDIGSKLLLQVEEIEHKLFDCIKPK